MQSLTLILPFFRKAEPAPLEREWSLELLKQLEWRRFEELCVAYYEALGLNTRIGATGKETGIDLVLYETRSDEPTALVRCKPWDAYRVGARPLRELRRAASEAGIAKGVLVIAGRFSQDAVAFAAGQNIELVDGAALLERIAALPPEEAQGLLQFTTEGDFVTPTCPRCSIKMVPRQSTREGRAFWGCPNYPACKQTFPA